MQSARLKLAIGLVFLVVLITVAGFSGLFATGADSSSFILIASGVGALVGLALAFIIFRSAMLPLMNVTRYATRLANGNYGAPFEGKAVGEYGQLKEAIDIVASNAVEKITECEDLDNQLAMARHETDAVRRDLEDSQAENDAQSRALIKGASKLKELADLLNNAASGLSDQVGVVTNGANNQRERSSESAAAMDQMNSTILEVARNASEAAQQAMSARDKAVSGAQVVDEVSAAVSTVNDLTDRMKGSVNGLGDQAKAIGQIMSVITDIADQTNLLALNAAIEAARAGEAGRGFAVVADEVRKLAEKTMDATKEVGEAVQGIQGGVQGSIDEMSQAAVAVDKASGHVADAEAALQDIVGIVELSADQAQAIAAAAEEQSAASEEITRSVDEVNETSSIIVHGMDESRSMIDNVSSYTTVLSDIIEDMADGDMTSIEQRDWSSLGKSVTASTPTAAPKTQYSSPSNFTRSPAPKPASRQTSSRNGSTSLMEWSAAYELGIPEIDDQHKRLVSLVNELNSAMKTGQGSSKLAQVFDELKNYTVHHFAHEEALFEEHNYPGMVSHVALHKKLVNQVLELEAKFKTNSGVMTTDVMNFLKDWLVNHIQGEDKKYVPHLIKAGVKGTVKPAPMSAKQTNGGNGGRKSVSLMEWSDEYVLDIEEMDYQHKKLVELVNQLNVAMKTGQGKDKLAQVFDDLKEYTVHHFASEEALMEESNYPGMVSHIGLHKKLVNQVLELEDKFKSDSGVLTTDVMNFLKNWLAGHIKGEDRKYVQHLHKSGIR